LVPDQEVVRKMVAVVGRIARLEIANPVAGGG